MTERHVNLWRNAEGEHQLDERQVLPGRIYPPDVRRMVLWLAAADGRMCSKLTFVVDAGRI